MAPSHTCKLTSIGIIVYGINANVIVLPAVMGTSTSTYNESHTVCNITVFHILFSKYDR